MEKILENKNRRVGKKADAQESMYAVSKVTKNIFQRLFTFVADYVPGKSIKRNCFHNCESRKLKYFLE